MQTSTILRWIVLVTFVASMLWLGNRIAEQAGGWVPHAVSHLSAATLGALFWVGAYRVQQRRGQPVSWTEGYAGGRIVVTGSVVFTLAQLVESMSAIIEYPDAGVIHSVSGLVTVLGLVMALAGVGVVAFVSMTGRRISRWVFVLVLLVMAFILVMMVFGAATFDQG